MKPFHYVSPLPSSGEFTGGASDKEFAGNAGDIRYAGSIPESGKSPGVGSGKPLQYSCLKNPQRSLVDYRPWDWKESDATERLSTHPLTPNPTRDCNPLESPSSIYSF